jgi:two-component system NtrC family sensor kinase
MLNKSGDGVERALSEPGSPADAGGSSRSIDLLTQRVAELEKENERLRHVEWFADSIIENIPDMVFVKEAENLRWVRLNRVAVEDYICRPREWLMGRSDSDVFSPEEAEFFNRIDRAVLASGKMLDIPEEPIHGKDGVRYLHTKKIPLLDENGVPRYLLGIGRDITERKRVMQELEQKNKLLEEAIRSEQQAHAALKQAQSRMLQSEKLAALGSLVAGVAHEVNNPLAFVTNNVAILQRDFAEVQQLLELYQAAESALGRVDAEALRKIRDVAERMDIVYILENLQDTLVRSRDGLSRIQQIVRDLREFSRQETVGSVQQGTELNPGIAATVNIVRGQARGSGVELEMELMPIPGITCYPARINQVVVNVLTNAIDACENGGKVCIGTRPAEGGVELWVKDTGCGIDPAVRDRIFDPFFTTKPQGKGTGLGLSISHGIVADHGGSIRVESSSGEGTCFTVFLPLVPPIRHEKSVKAVDVC